jgi:hypothetical protein
MKPIKPINAPAVRCKLEEEKGYKKLMVFKSRDEN